MRAQIKLGRIFGIQIGLHYSWFLIAFLIVVSLASQFRITNPKWGETTILALSLATGVLFFFFLLLHELSTPCLRRRTACRSARSSCLR